MTIAGIGIYISTVGPGSAAGWVEHTLNAIDRAQLTPPGKTCQMVAEISRAGTPRATAADFDHHGASSVWTSSVVRGTLSRNMANIDHEPSRFMLNLLHALPAFADEKAGIVNVILEVSSGSINKYELITESGQLKLHRVGYSSLAYPFTYGAIPCTWDLDGDPL